MYFFLLQHNSWRVLVWMSLLRNLSVLVLRDDSRMVSSIYSVEPSKIVDRRFCLA